MSDIIYLRIKNEDEGGRSLTADSSNIQILKRLHSMFVLNRE